MPADSGDTRRLRTALRDLVALSTIPAAWVGREPPAIVAGLADVLVGALHVDFAFVRLCDANGGAAVDVTRGDAWKAFPQWLERHLAAGGPHGDAHVARPRGRKAIDQNTRRRRKDRNGKHRTGAWQKSAESRRVGVPMHDVEREISEARCWKGRQDSGYTRDEAAARRF